jgi:tellurite resistance protein TerC
LLYHFNNNTLKVGQNTSILDLHPGLVWGFAVTVVIMLLLDLGVFNKKSHEVSSKEATIWSIVWISLSMVFSGVVYWVYNSDLGPGSHALAVEKFTQYQAAYWIEKALSVDNLFVFILVFGFFKVPKYLHHKVLFWGIIGALVFRAIFIFAGVGLINLTYLPEMNIFGYPVKINVVMTLFGLFLVYAGIKSWGDGDDDDEEDYSNTAGARLIKRFWKVSDNYVGDKFFTVQNGMKMATPLLVVVAVIEFTDVLFAVDSIPAIFAISNDPFILYTSNIFAILGLRSLYFLLANFIHMFSKLPYGLAVILSFIGVKMLIAPWIHIPSPVSLGIVGGVLIISVILSLIFPDKKEEKEKIEE